MDLEKETRERLRDNTFMNYNHVELDSCAPDHAVFRLTICPESRNPYGLIHGGAIYTMADNAAGTAAHSDGRFYVTQCSSMHFLRNVAEGTVYATAKTRHRGKATCLIDVDITAEDGKLLATGDFTFFCVDPAEMEKKGSGAQKK